MATTTQMRANKAEEGETLTLSTTAQYLAFKPGFDEVKMYCATQWRRAICPKLVHCVYYDLSVTTYYSYLTQVTDGSSTTHLPLDAMATNDYLYLGTFEPVRGFWFDVGTNVNAVTATLDFEYLKAISITAYAASSTKTQCTSASHGMSDGEIVTIIGTHAYNGTYTVESSAANTFVIDKTFATDEATGTGKVFADVASDVDGTDATGTSTGATLGQDGAYTFTLPTVTRSTLGTALVPLYTECYWYRFAPSLALTSPTDINEIIPIYKNTNYGYREGGGEYQDALNKAECGGFALLASAATPTLDITWVKM